MSILTTEEFIQSSKKNIPVVDVRSPAEFLYAHFPGAVNRALLDNDERAMVGTTFKKNGREQAITKGFQLVGHKFADYIEDIKKIAPEKNVLIYCWRGGLRSNIMAWLLTTAGFNVSLLKNGYKNYRNWTLNQLQVPKKIIIIGGKTGSGKTELLQLLHKKGEQVIDLEHLASHKGSAFGGLGLPAQPGNEQFENELAMQWNSINAEQVLFLENESRHIGRISVPAPIFEMMRTAPVMELMVDTSVRKERILAEYGNFNTEDLKEKTNKIAGKLGGLRLKQAKDFLENNQLDEWCAMMLDYYDKQYEHSGSQRHPHTLTKIDCSPYNLDDACNLILKHHTDKII